MPLIDRSVTLIDQSVTLNDKSLALINRGNGIIGTICKYKKDFIVIRRTKLFFKHYLVK